MLNTLEGRLHAYYFFHNFSPGVTRRIPHVEQELPTLPEHMSSRSVFSRVCVARTSVLCKMFCRSFFVHCIVCASSIYGFDIFKLFLERLHMYFTVDVKYVWEIAAHVLYHSCTLNRFGAIVYVLCYPCKIGSSI